MFAQDSQAHSLRCVATDSIPADLADLWQAPSVTGESLAFLQYTSGSTSTPKGVMVSHGNLLHNERMIKEAFQQSERSVIVGWLPLYHDMGLIGNVLQPLYLGARCILMSPVAFLQRPLRWLDAISRYKASTSGGPNFAYELCARKISLEDRATLDLSNWSTAFNGAEPVRAETLDRFTEAFKDSGFKRESFYPCYGLAEAILLVSGSMKKERPFVSSFSSAALTQNRVRNASVDSEESRQLVGCGQVLSGQRIAIVNAETLTECPQGEVGEIWVSGPSIAQGYWKRRQETERTFEAFTSDSREGPFLRTGDLGFLSDGELFITGRVKDLIIIRGLNHYPQDVELSVEQSHQSLRPDCGAAFSVDVMGEERLVIVQELQHGKHVDFDEIIGSICKKVSERHDVQVYAVALIKSGSLPKTSSGKIQRHACRNQFWSKTLNVVAEWQSSIAQANQAASSVDAPIIESIKDVEDWLASLLAATLGLNPDRIEINEPITRYGIDSLNAIELVHNIESTLGVQLSVSSFLQSQTIAQLAVEAMSQLTVTTPANSSLLASSRAAVASNSLSYGQKALWFLHQLAPDSAAYNITSAVRIRGELDALALKQAFQAIVDRHPSLRTTFTNGSEPASIIHDRLEVYFQYQDESRSSDAELDKQLSELMCQPFDLERGPLMRVTLLKRSEVNHVLLLSVHHIVTDFWSLAVVIHEMGALYSAAKNLLKPALNPLRLAYTDYVRWQSEMLAGAEGERLWNYWQKQLAGVLLHLNLPTDRPRPPVQTYMGSSHPLRLNAELSAGLMALSRQNEATLFMTLLAAFQALLHRYTGDSEILLGSPTSGRNRAELTGLVGYFVNPVVLKARFSEHLAFTDLLSQVRGTALEAFDHQDYPLALLVERLQPVRDPARAPLFQVLFSLQKILSKEQGLTSFALGEAGAQMKLGELHLESLAVEQRVAQFDLTLMMAEVEDSLVASFQYNSDLFDSSTIARLANHYRTILESIMADPAKRISDLALLTGPEMRQILFEWNATQADYPSDLCAHELFEARARLTPDKTAVSFEGESLTYAGLNSMANKLARFLRAAGVGQEARVAICVERSIDMVVGMLGILKAGGAYVPLDYTHPAERIAFLLEDSKAPVILTQSRLLSIIPETDARIICLDLIWQEIEPEDGFDLTGEVTPANLAYVIYTSGSTGKPKGVQIEHRALVNFLSSMLKQPGLNSEDVLLAVTTISFDIAGLEIFLPLIVGARLELISRDEAADARALMQKMAHSGVTVMQATPATWRLLIDGGWQGDSRIKILCGGEAVPFDLANELRQRSCSLWNMYGPTETTIWSAATQVNPSDHIITIGHPIDNTQIYLLDRSQQPVPIGVAGELYIGGDGLARGYLSRPELTAEKFVPDAFGDESGLRLYATGDLARYAPDGKIEFLGRIDHQVKVRGFRIEVGEIESALQAHPSISDAAVVASDHQSGEKRLVAYVVPAFKPPTIAELRSFVKQKLPDFMVPSVFVILESLPLTPNGKVDRKALPAPGPADFDLPGSSAAPRTLIEEVLVEIWSSVLGLKRVGIEDNFFELGGHSLLATQVISRVRETFNVEMPLRKLFESPTVKGMALSIEAMRGTITGIQAPPVEMAPRDEELPLSFAQQRLWFLNDLIPDSPLYNVPAPVSIRGHLDLILLKQGLSEIVRRHDILRTSFPRQDSDPVQVVASSIDLPLELIDLTSLPDDERKGEAMRIAQVEAREVFDLTRGPLLRTTLLSLGEQEHWLLLTMHHIITDGWSMGIILRELAQVYEAFLSDSPSPLRELAIQYGDFAHWQRQWLQGDLLDQQLSYWKHQLDAIQPLQLPSDKPRPATRTFVGQRLYATLPQPLVQALEALSRREGVTLYMTLLAAFNVLLSRYSGQLDIALGTPIANRNRGEIEDLIGFFVNTLVIRTDLSGNPSFRQLLKRVREVTLAAFAHQDLPFEKLVEELHPQRDLSQTPLFQAVFAMQNFPLPLFSTAGLSFEPLEIDTATAKFDLTLSVMPVEQGGLLASLEYSSELFENSTIVRMVTHLQNLLAGILDDPLRRVGDLPLLSEQERRLILVDWNSTASDYRPERCVHELFQAQAERSPQAVAVVYENQQLTYDELNRRANRLAHCLRELGVGPEVLVGLCVERSLDMVIGLLGVLKAGGAYVPLDPSYPAERLEVMLRDCGARVLVTHSHLRQQRPGDGTQVIYLDEDWPMIAAASDANPKNLTLPENLAYVIYTSGSTGTPKGVGIQHTGLVNLINCHNTSYQIKQEDRASHFSALGFDGTGWEIWPYLVAGACVQVMDEQTRTSAEAVHEFIIGNRITRAFLPPVLSEVLLQRSWPENAALRTLLTGGDRAVSYPPPGLPFEYWNHYGPTEATVTATRARVDTQMAVQGPPAIGRPLDNFRIFVLDSNLEPVPPLVAGELYIAGVGLARGYLSASALTAEKFIPDPHTGEHGARMYRTGDVARYLHDGTLEFLGRNDHQVKLRGFRIELGEIEAILAHHPKVRDVVALVREDVIGDKRLITYVVAKAGEEFTSRELSGFVQQRLPNYMQPSAFVVLDSLPLTPNGKVDRKALPAPDNSDARQAGAYKAPRSHVEEVLALLWGQVLGVEEVGVEDSFFALGGHSLLAAQLVSRVREAFKLEMPLRLIFEAATIARMAEAIEILRKAEEGLIVPPITRGLRNDRLPLSFAQQRLWFLDQMEPGNTFFNVPVSIRLVGRLNVKALEQSFNEIVRRHEVLRARFEKVNNEVVQRAIPELAVKLSVTDLSGFEEDERKNKVEDLSAREAAKPFDLARGPLLRIGLLRLGEQEHEALLTIHHIVCDAWSMALLVREVAALYEAYCNGLPSPLPELPIQYADFSVWQREWLQGEALDTQLAYWKRQLNGSPAAMELPADYPREAMREYRSAQQTLALSLGLSESLKGLSKHKAVTLFMTLLAAFKTLLYRSTGQKDVIVGTDVANRNRVEVEGLIGFFVNQLVLRTDLSGNPSFSDLLGRVRDVTLGAYDHQDVPFEKLVEVLKPARDKNRPPLFQIKFVMQKAFNQPVELAGLIVGSPKLRIRLAQFDLQLSVEEANGQLIASVEYNAELFEPATIAELLKRFEILLIEVAANPEAKILDIPLLEKERRGDQSLAGRQDADSAVAEFVF
jgi:amino acid adenylation domain-containing protein